MARSVNQAVSWENRLKIEYTGLFAAGSVFRGYETTQWLNRHEISPRTNLLLFPSAPANRTLVRQRLTWLEREFWESNDAPKAVRPVDPVKAFTNIECHGMPVLAPLS